MNTNRRINSFGRILKINNQTKIWYDIRNINLKRKGEFNAPKYSPAVKKKLGKPDFWLTHVIIYFALLFTSKLNDSKLMMIIVAITYPIFIALFTIIDVYVKQKIKPKLIGYIQLLDMNTSIQITC